MTDLTKLADELAKVASNYTASMYREDSEHIREAARILRAAAAVDVAGLMTERQISVINFALHRFSSHAHQNANAAGQDIQGAYYKKGAFEAFLKDAEDAEELLSKKPYAALESALRMALAGREEWQPIETAPKDVAVLLWGKYWNNKDVFQRPLVGQWNPISNPQRWEALGEYRFGIRPTHWMPLPAAPKGTP